MNREIAADAVAGAMIEIETRIPERLAGERVSICAPLVPFGNTIVAMAMWPFRTRVKRSFISGVGSPTMTVRVMSVVPSSYCAPESTRKIWLSSSSRLLAALTR